MVLFWDGVRDCFGWVQLVGTLTSRRSLPLLLTWLPDSEEPSSSSPDTIIYDHHLPAPRRISFGQLSGASTVIQARQDTQYRNKPQHPRPSNPSSISALTSRNAKVLKHYFILSQHSQRFFWKLIAKKGGSIDEAPEPHISPQRAACSSGAAGCQSPF